MRCVKQVLILAVLLLMPCLVQAGYLTPDLQAKLDQTSPNDKLKVIVRMAEEADISVFPQGQWEAMVQYLKDFAAISQTDLLATLPRYGNKVSQIKPFWIYNGIAMEATKDVVLNLLRRPDVGCIEEKGIIKIEPLPGKKEPRVNGLEWNIARIQADRVWRELGYTGRGIVVGNIDTGVNVNHPTFGGRWRGGSNSWFDPINHQSYPYDDNGHGTHTMGIACGGSTADSIGVAPGATFVATKAFDASGNVEVDACMQWYAGLGSAAPNIISNSWGVIGNSTHYWQITRNLQILGIHQVYANGNSGPDSGTVGYPASYPHHIGVGGTTTSDTLASWSSRGPSPYFGAIESSANYLDPVWASSRRKPDLTAPGLNVRSAWYDTTYRVLSSTSMSAPHVAGVMALMLEKNPNLTDPQIWQILTSTCDTFSWGGPYPNQNYGWGRLNAYRAVLATPPSGVDEEAARSPVSRLPFSVRPNPFTSFFAVPGHETECFSLYDISGRRVGTYRGDRIGEGLQAGVYFVRAAKGDQKPLRVVKVR
jgi:bacillopeptidase F